MTEATGQKGNRMLVLGFDAGCGTCSEIARRVEERVGDTLTVRNLGDPEVTGWREEALGEDAPWAPTLFELDGDEVRAWTGKKMALPLSRKLGLSKTWQLMQALGEMPNAGIPTLDAPMTSAGMSRGRFLKGVGGAAVAMSILSGVGPLASITQAAEKKPYDVIKARKLTGSELTMAARRVGGSADVKNLVGQKLSTPARVKAAKPVAYLHMLRNRTAQRVIVFKISADRLVTHTEYTKPPAGTAPTRAMLLVAEDKRATAVKVSEGGRLLRVASSTRTLSQSGSRSRPLGECPPVGNKPSSSCYKKQMVCAEWTFSLRCAGTAVTTYSSCGGCYIALAGTAVAPPSAVGAAVLCPGCGGGIALTAAACCAQWCEAWVYSCMGSAAS